MKLEKEMVGVESTIAAPPESLMVEPETIMPPPDLSAEAIPEPPVKQGNPKREDGLTPRQVVAWFSACPRCSFFLTGYRIEYGIAGLETAVTTHKSGWLTLRWKGSMCKLVRKSYGGRLDADCYYYAGFCSECQRQFVYQAADAVEEPDQFRIELKPRTGE